MKSTSRVLKSEYFLLAVILVFAYFAAFIPHSDSPYPVHLDEWVLLANSNQLNNHATSVGITDPFSGGSPNYNQVGEIGMQLFAVIFHQVSGLDWTGIFRYLPALIFVFTVFAVYALARRWNFGLEAALIASLVPTTVGILGPGFLVPQSLILGFIPLALLIGFRFRAWWGYLLLSLIVMTAVSVHAPTAVCLIIILVPYISMTLKSEFKHGLALIGAVVVPLAVISPAFYEIVFKEFKLLFVEHSLLQFVGLPQLIPAMGYIPVTLSGIGIIALVFKWSRETIALVLGVLALLIVAFVYSTFHFGSSILFYRLIVPAMLILSVLAGAGLKLVRNIRLSSGNNNVARYGALLKNAGALFGVPVILAMLAIAVPYRLNIPYYHMVGDEDVSAFNWIKQNVDTQKKAVLDPWEGSAFVALTQMKVYSFIGEAPAATDQQAYQFLNAGCVDMNFIESNGLTVVYTLGECGNPTLIKVSNGVYLLPPSATPQNSVQRPGPK